MAKPFVYETHPNAEARRKRGPAVAKGQKLSFNEKFGLLITNRVGTMWAAYAFALLSLVSLPAALASQDPLIIVAWIAQTFLQLVLLPIIIVGQNIQAKAADERAIATYEDADAILHDAKQIQVHLEAQDEALAELLDKVRKLETKLEKSTKR
ncbi:MAG: hypothetical protein ACKOWE_02085 [Micrococcales bacterium]